MSNERKLNTRATGVIALAVMCSRVLGLVREMLFAGLFGSALMGIFTIAFRAPNLLRDLFAEGALSTAFITVFSQKIEKEGNRSAWSLASKMMTLTAIFMSGVSLLGVIFAKELIGILAPGFAPQDARLTIQLTQIMYPFILLVSLAALVMGMLNAKNVFGVPAMASSFFNIGSIAGGVLFGWLFDPGFGEKALTGLAIGTLVGGLLQFAVQLPSLRRVGYKFRPDLRWRDPGIRKILLLMVPSAIAASAVQINVMVNSSFASFIGKEAVSWLNFAFRLMQLPIGVFGVAVATITLPVVSRIAVHSDRSEFGPTLGKAMRLAVFLTLPSAVGLFFLAQPIIGVIYERGEFKPTDTLQTGLALQFYSIGLVAYSCIKVLSPAFYAIDKKWTPMCVSFAAIGLNFCLNYFFIFRLGLGQRGLALATSLSATANFLALYLLMRHDARTLETRRFLGAVVRCGLASAALGLVCWLGADYSASWLGNPSLLRRAAALLAVIACAGSAYLIVCFALRVEEVTTFWGLLSAKFLRRAN
ncbi:MAG TPA: murein biosynthesis integral membrane protein MurJ [Terrimicrobiaceae bacterium]